MAITSMLSCFGFFVVVCFVFCFDGVGQKHRSIFRGKRRILRRMVLTKIFRKSCHAGFRASHALLVVKGKSSMTILKGFAHGERISLQYSVKMDSCL